MPIDYFIAEGDSIASLAVEYGFFVNTIWNHPANAGLKQKRKDMNVLMPGDKVTIPDLQIKQESRPTEKRHRFKRKGVPAIFRLQVFDVEKPRANQNYQLTVDGRIFKGTTDANGVLQISLPPDAREGKLIIGSDRFEYGISFGYLDPSNELTGIQKRLNNLGYWCGDPDGELNGLTQQALALFQERFGLPITSQADNATISKLAEVHDKQNTFPQEPS